METVDIWQIIKSVKREVLLVIHGKKWAILLQSADLKTNINSVDKKKPEGIYYIDLRSSESGSKSFLVDSGASVNIIDIEILEQISKVCEIDVENTNSKIYTFGSNDPLKLKGKFNN